MPSNQRKKTFLSNALSQRSKVPSHVLDLERKYKKQEALVLGRIARRFVFKPKIPILVNLEVLEMENVVLFYYHLEYFTAIWYNLLPFGIVCGHLVYFLRFGMFGPRKIWQPWFEFE
jgi:hypothetical protein